MKMEQEKVTIPKFTGSDFPVWKAKIEAIIIDRGLEAAILNNRPVIAASATQESKDAVKLEIESFDKKEKAVRSLLLQALDNKHARLVLSCRNCREMWTRLIDVHSQKSAANKMVLQSQFYDLKMKHDESVQDFVSRAEYVYQQLLEIGVAIDEATLVNRIVTGLPKRYITFMSSWSTMDRTNHTIAVLLPRLMAEESLLNKFKQVESGVAMMGISKKNKRFKRFNKNKKFNKNQNNSNKHKTNGPKGNNSQKRKGSCYICKKEDHWADKCPNKKSTNKNNGSGSATIADGYETTSYACMVDTEDSDNNYNVLKNQLTICSFVKPIDDYDNDASKYNGNHDIAICNYSNKENLNSSEVWHLDSGASEHMTYDDKNLYDIKTLDYTKPVMFANGNQGRGMAVGKINVIATDEDPPTKLILKNVLYVPECKRKLVSLSALGDAGHHGNWDKTTVSVYSKSNIHLFDAKRSGKLYQVNFNEVNYGYANNATSKVDDLTLWHQRFGHVNKKALKRMVTNQSVNGMNCSLIEDRRNNTDRVDCHSCALGKQPRKHFPNRTTPRATTVGRRVHVDLCGPVGVPTLSGCKYFVLFKDEFSTYRIIYFVKTKDEVFDCVRKCYARITAETNKVVKELVSDCGSELISKRTQEFLLSKSVIHTVAAPYTPQQNGLIERDNRTVIEAGRTMLFHRKLPEKLWGEAVNTAVYLLNRSVNVISGNETPFERYFGNKPNCGHLRIFGSIAFMKMQEKKRSGYQKKLEPRAKKTILVGYDRDYTYRVYDPLDDKIIITRDVNIDETLSIKLNDTEPTYEEINILLSNINDNTVEVDNDNSISSLSEDEETFADAHGSPHLGEESMNISLETRDNQFDQPSSSANQDEPSSHAPSTSTNTNTQSNQTSKQTTSKTKEVIPTRTIMTRSKAKEQSSTPSNLDYAEALLTYGNEPLTYREAITCDESIEWKKAMDDEYNSLLKNNTWVITNLPSGRKPIKCMWIYKLKYKVDGSIDRYKARLVAKGYSQKAGIDYQETFSPVVRLDSVKLILSMVSYYNLNMIHIDIKTAFLYGKLVEEIYMEQPQGYEKDRNKVCLLKKSLYGLKQAPRVWNKCFVDFLKKFELKPLVTDSCILTRQPTKADNKILIAAIYVDDGLICSNDNKLEIAVIDHLKKAFEITIMDPKCFVGLQIQRDRKNKTIFINQSHYVEKILERFNMKNCSTRTTPLDINLKLCLKGSTDDVESKNVDVPYREAIGSLMYLMIGTRPDIAFAINLLSRYSNNPKLAHWKALKRVLQYVSETKNLGILYEGKDLPQLKCYVDSDYAACIDTRRSTCGFVISINGGSIIWKSTKQKTVATSTVEAEFTAASLACKEILWCRQLLKELNWQQTNPTEVFIDNQGAIKLIVNNKVHPKTKHVDVQYMFIREVVESNQISVSYVRSENQLADILTKALPRDKHINLRKSLSVVEYNRKQ